MNKKTEKRIKVINSIAPIRICDNGGWTDTWFAEYGKVFNIAVYPYVEVQIEVYASTEKENQIIIQAENYGDKYTINHEKNKKWTQHPLLEAAIKYMKIPYNVSLKVIIYSEAPTGCSTGTSAAVTVALIGALDHLTPGRMTPHEVAYTAQMIETKMLSQQCGIQDQFCSAYGGINFIEMTKYPFVTVSKIEISNSIWWELEKRLTLIFLGKSHVSSAVHQKVIKELESVGAKNEKLEKLRKFAEKSKNALYSGNLKELGKIMCQNTEIQATLHPEIVSKDAYEIIKIAKKYNVAGWKVNGAGGDGGSITLLCNNLFYEKRKMIKEIEEINPLFKNIPIYLSRHGLRVWES
ncbi:MAG: GHMP kinase [bacterium]